MTGSVRARAACRRRFRYSLAKKEPAVAPMRDSGRYTRREPLWIRFEVCESPAHRRLKTTVWRVVAKDGDAHLGEIRWYAHWRRYTFQPGPRGTVFEPTCLRDIAAFIDEQMAARKAAGGSNSPFEAEKDRKVTELRNAERVAANALSRQGRRS